MEYSSTYLEEKRNYLNSLIEKDSSNLLSSEVIKASEELDLLIYEYQLFIKNHNTSNN
ncbi:aspartyl-phosphate phosphatase Spo0E family protein [Clostridium grantii]|uniref:Spo0E like sporulation regulatory protein n=1 Tax=Clostridium grantii DSM 8605 TaxID=1121316 RepID=A0A1M5WXU3_9CLOT|nr:aspartyl-phosphate phosphatase Spo0E family protein [Clostridium grantii]SHH92377.1 Spo0E like sporulation regulatory protein [Clostridium grantii DSM 8605]